MWGVVLFAELKASYRGESAGGGWGRGGRVAVVR